MFVEILALRHCLAGDVMEQAFHRADCVRHGTGGIGSGPFRERLYADFM